MKRFSSIGRQIMLSACLAALVVPLTACSLHPPPVEPPKWNPPAQAAKAMELYDKNGDGKLAGDELSPALKVVLPFADKDGDRALSLDELTKRLQQHAERELGLTSIQGRVIYNGRAAAGATVRFIPEPFLADVLLPAEGEVSKEGYYMMQAPNDDNLPGMQPGIYRVEISRKDGSGRETLPARVNSQSDLGWEVGLEFERPEPMDEVTWQF